MLTHMFAGKIKKEVIKMLQEKLQMFGSYFNDQLMALIEQARIKSVEYPFTQLLHSLLHYNAIPNVGLFLWSLVALRMLDQLSRKLNPT